MKRSMIWLQALPTDPELWKDQGGILGLIILFLLVACAITWRWLIKHMDDLAITHAKERNSFLELQKTLHGEHKAERNEFLAKLEKLTDAIDRRGNRNG